MDPASIQHLNGPGAWNLLPKPISLPIPYSNENIHTPANQDSQDEIIPLFLYVCNVNCNISRIDSSKPLEEEWSRIQNTCVQVVGNGNDCYK